MISPRRVLIAAAGLALSAAIGWSAEVRHEPESPVFEELIGPNLTTLEEVLKIDTTKIEDLADGGVLVLDEELRAVSADATATIVYHRVIKPKTDAGIELASQFVFPYNRTYQRVSLVTARTRALDGTVTNVNGDATFIQTPQHQADQGIYTDSEELVVLFSNVKVGYMVEYVVVVEIIEPRMPGAWGTVVQPGSYWPTARFRSRLLIEEPLAGTLRVAPLGGPLPTVTTPPAPPGWRAWEWSENELAPLAREIDRAPTSQIGPAIHLTTVPSWDDVASWYDGLLASRSELTPKIAAQVDTWTKGLADPSEILGVLHRKVADDVRYTGLEFGIGALRPRTPDDVWSSQYGDCKDKANLLRVMLAHRGIEAYMVLVNTIHAGRIEHRTPHYNQFNHAILAVDIGDERVLCDPTLPNSEPGLLSPSDTGREVLIFHDARGELISIPSQDAGRLRYGFDLEVGVDGSIRGWLQIDANRVRGARFADYFRFLDEHSRRRRFHSLVDLFFEGSDLIDIEFPDGEDATGSDFSARGFFVVSGVQGGDRTAAVLKFPDGGMVFPYLEDDDDRTTQWYHELETTEIEIRYVLANGWREQSALPQPLKISSPAAEGEARWSHDDEGALVASLTYRTLLDLVDQREFPRFRKAVAALQTWMDAPLTVAPTNGEHRNDPRVVEIDMPMMPSGEGQLRLVDRLFPSDGDPDRRRAALLQVQQLFPDSSESVLDVQVWLAQLDAQAGHSEEAIQRIERAIQTNGDKVPRESVAWARYHLAFHQFESGKTDAAFAGFEAIAKNTDLSQFRRATAYEMLAVIHLEAENEDLAIQTLDEGLAIESEMDGDLHDQRARLMVESGRSEELEFRLRREIEARPHTAQWTFQSLTTTVANLSDEGHIADAAVLAGLLLAIADSSPSIQLTDQRSSELEELARTTLAYSEIATAISKYLQTEAPAWLKEAGTEFSADSLEDLEDAMDRFDAEGRVSEYIRYGLERLARYQTSIGDFGNDLWHLAVVTELKRAHDPLLDSLIGWGLALPRSDDFFFETLIVQARQLERNGETEKALELLKTWSASPEVTAVYRVAFLAQLGLHYENLGEWESALESYRQLEPDRDSNLSGYDALLRAAFLNLGLGRIDDAIRVIGLLADLDEESLAYCDSPAQIAQLVTLAENPELAKRFWALERDWMPVWESLARAVGLEPAPPVVVPILPDVYEAAVELGMAINAEAPTTYFEGLQTFVQGARWHPEMVFEVCSLSSETSRMAPEHRDLVQALVVGLASGLDIGDDLIFKRSRLVLATYYVDQNLYPQAVTVGRDYLGRFEPDDAIGQAIVRLWGLAAAYSGLDREPAVKRLEKVLAAENLEDSRTVTVYVLSKLYGELGRTEDELRLIESEIINGKPDNQRYGERLTRRHAELQGDVEKETDFAAAVEDWFNEFSPSWYDATAPTSFDDPLVKQIDRDIEEHSDRFEETELIKYRLLLARNTSRPESGRHQAFAFAVSDLVALAVSSAEADAVLEAIVTEERLPRFIRFFPLWTALDDAFDRSDRPRLSRWMTTTAFKAWDADERERITLMRDSLPDPSDDSATIAGQISQMVEGPLDDTDVRILRKNIERLLQLGDFASAEKVIKSLESATFETQFQPSGAALRLEFRRHLKAHSAEWPSNEVMRTTVIEGFESTIASRPQALDDIADVNHIDHLHRDQAFAIRLYLLATRQYEVPSALFWSTLVDDLRDLHDQEIARRVLEVGVAAAHDDEIRSSLLLYLGSSCFDIDDPGERARFNRLMAPMRDNPAAPLSRASTVLLSGSLAARQGQSFDVSAINEAAATLEVGRGALRLRLIQARRAGPAKLRRELEAIPADDLVDPFIIPLVLPSLRAVGLDDEADLVAEVGRDLAHRDMLRSWSSPNGRAVRSTLRLCGVLEEEDCLAPEWLEDMSRTLGNRELALEVKLTDAELRHDWSTARDAAAELVSQRPRFYDLYWRLGRAEAGLENKSAATEALRTFIRHCHDSQHYEAAEELLEMLMGGPGV